MPQYNIKQVKGSTQGSVLFLSPNGSISENNLQLFWSSTQSSLSIGTSSATSKLSVVAQSNIPALSLGTSVASDVIMYFYTNNSTNNRAKIYVDDTLQTFNLYTQNNDTIFWNGNGLAQTKTLTLFTDTSAKFENNLQVAGNLLVNGSFSVLGSASVINTQNLTIQDPIILLASTQSGTPTLDSGFFINRGTGATQAFIWDESDSKFVFIQTNDASNAIGNVNINTGAQIRALRYNFFDSGSPAAAASATINAPSGGSIALNAAASVQFITPQLASSNQVTSWDIGANTLEFGGSNTRSFKLGIADGGSGIPTFMFYSTSAGSSGTSRTGMSFSHVIGSQLNNVLERGFVIETRDGGTYSGTAVGLTIDVTGVTNSNRFKYGLRIIDGKQSNGYVLVSDVNGFSSWTSSSVILASANGVTGSGTTNYVPKWSSVNSLGDSIITSGVNNVGVNVINPSATLDILGGTQNNYPLKLSSTNNTLSRLQHLNLGSVQTDVQVGVNNGSNSIYLGVLGSSVPYLDNRTGQSFTYQVSGVTKLSIDNNGNVGFDLGRGLVYNSGVVFTTDTFNGSSLIIGRGATGTNQAGESYIALGNSAHSTELGIAIGSSADVRENTLDGIAIGRASLVSGGLTRGIAIGRNANARHNNAWAIGYNAITTQDNEFNFGASGTLHKYTFNGQVGIGTASSTVGLHIVATQAGAGFRLVDTTEGVGRVLVSDINGVGTWSSSSSIFSGPTGSGTVNYVVRWVTSTQLGNGSIYDSGTAVGIATQSNGSYALNVNGDVNINGTLYATSNLHVIGLANITPGPTTSNISVGGTLCEYTNDGSSVGTLMTTLYTTSGLVNTANLLSRVGDRLKGVFAGYFTGDPTSTKSVHLYYGGNDLFGTTAITYSGTTYWRVEFTILRYSISTQIRHEVTITTYDTSTGESKIEQTSGAYGGFDFTSDMAIELKGQSVGAGTIDGDVISRMGYIDYNPAKI